MEAVLLIAGLATFSFFCKLVKDVIFLYLDEGEVQKRAGEDVKDSTQGEMDAVSAFHKLLIVRMLRPDRLTIAMSSYVQAHLNLSIVGGGSSSVYRDLQAMVGSLHAGVLILMPPRPAGNLQQPLSSLSMTRHPADILQDVAKVRVINPSESKWDIKVP